MSGHFLNLKEAAIVATEQLLDAQAMISEAVEAQAMVAIHGAAGTGKSFAVEQALIDLPARSWVWMDFRCRPTLRDVRHALHRATGLGSILAADAFGVDMALKAALADRPRLVVIDEAQWLNRVPLAPTLLRCVRRCRARLQMLKEAAMSAASRSSIASQWGALPVRRWTR